MKKRDAVIKPFPKQSITWSETAEAAVIGGLMLDNNAWPGVAEILAATDFYRAQHQLIFQAMGELAKKGNPVDFVLVSERLQAKGKLDDAGGEPYLAVLARDCFSAANILHHARAIKKYSIERQRVAAGQAGKWERIEELNRKEKALEETGNPKTSGTLGAAVLTVQQLREMELPERKMLLDWLPEAGLGMIYSQPGLGKTVFGLSLTGALVSGQPFMKWGTSEPIEVLYIDGEMSLQEMQERTRELVPEHTKKPFHLLSHEWLFQQDEESTLSLCDPRQQAELHTFLDEHPGIKLVILDNLSCLFPEADEDKRDDWVRLVQPFMLWMRRRGIACLLKHHAGKGGDQRGSSAREGIMDVVIRLDRPDGWLPGDGAHFVVNFRKSRSVRGPAVEPVEARLDHDEANRLVWTLKRHISDERADIVELLTEEGPMQPRDIAEALDKKGCNIRKLLSKMVATGQIHKRFDRKYEVLSDCDQRD